MKLLIITLLFCLPFICFGQATLQLKHDSTSVWVGAYEHPLNSLRARFLDADSTLAIWGTDNTVFAAARRFSNYTDDSGTPFSSYGALKAYIRQYFFVEASVNSIVSQIINGGYFETSPINIVTSDTLTVRSAGTYTFTGSIPKIWTMPTVASATSMTIFIINRGSAALTITSNAGGADLDVNGVYSITIIVMPGENYVLRGNSLKLVTVNN